MKVAFFALLIVVGIVIFIDFDEEPATARQASEYDSERIYVKPESVNNDENKLEMKERLKKKNASTDYDKKKAARMDNFFSSVTKEGSESKEERIKRLLADANATEEKVEEKVREEKIQEEPVVKTRVVYVPVKEEIEPDPVEVKSNQRRKVGFSTVSGSGSMTTAASTGKASSNTFDGIEVVVQRDVVVITGDVVKMRVTDDVDYNGIRIKKNSYIDGIAKVTNGNLYIDVDGFTVNGQFVSKKLSAYGTNGRKGFDVNNDDSKGAGQDVVKNATGAVTQQMQMPLGIGRIADNLAKDKVDEPSAKLMSGTKMILKI